MPTHTNIRAHDLAPRPVAIETLKPLGQEARKHPPHQIAKLAQSLERFGFVAPVLIDAHKRVVAGWALVQASQRLLLSEVPAVTVHGLSEAQLRMLRLALNRLSEDARWDPAGLKLEFGEILDLEVDVDLTLTGFEMAEIDLSLATEDDPREPAAAPPDRSQPAIAAPGDLWHLGDHRLYCGSALEAEAYAAVMGEDRAQAVHADPPYNLRIDGQVSGKGRITHGEFAMASGELSSEAFIEFLATAMQHMVAASADGALHYLWMDWRHLRELLTAGQGLYSSLLNLCVWTKTNGGMGSLYRSQHELVAVFKRGTGPHINNVQLGRYGRNRTNVWPYPGANTFRAGRLEDLAEHPTVKPMRMIADAILDSTQRGDVVLDPFLGSGTTLLACADTGRRGRGIELDPYYVDVAIRRWEALTGESAHHAVTGQTFAETARDRSRSDSPPSDSPQRAQDEEPRDDA
jgi:DNA modification methylase